MEPIGLSSGLLTLAAFALQSSKTLYELIDSFRNHGRNARQLKEELEALTVVLDALHQTVGQNALDLSALELPLRRCGQACQEFAEVITKCTSRTQGTRANFRDWFKISYMGKDIAGFTSLVAGYKATITIALGDANIRTTKVTIDLLREYQAMIATTTSDLEDILQDLDARMRDPLFNSASVSDQATSGGSATEEERASIQQCLKICMQVSAHIDQVQLEKLADVAVLADKDGGAASLDRPGLARLRTSETLKDCKRGLSLTTFELQSRLQDAERRMMTVLAHEKWATGGEDHGSMKEELDSVKRCLSICANAAEEVRRERVNVFEDVLMADDAHQFIVSTMGDLISAKRVTTGSRSTQLLGQMSDATVQHVYTPGGTNNLGQDEHKQVNGGTHFENRHGTRQKSAK